MEQLFVQIVLVVEIVKNNVIVVTKVDQNALVQKKVAHNAIVAEIVNQVVLAQKNAAHNVTVPVNQVVQLYIMKQ